MDMTVKEYEKRGYDNVFQKAYINMKQANCKDAYICAMLGISANKLRQIKKQEKLREEEDEVYLTAYINMKHAKCKDKIHLRHVGYLCKQAAANQEDGRSEGE